MTEVQAEQIIIWYGDLENRLDFHLQTIPLSQANLGIYYPLLAPIVVEAGSLIDTIFREAYVPPPKVKEKLTIEDYASHYEPIFKFSTVASLTYKYPPLLLKPFEGWTNKKTGKFAKLEWWAHYNKLKHDRIQKYGLATLKTTLYALCGLHQVITMLPTFIPTLWRHRLLSSRQFVHYIGRGIEFTNVTDQGIVESKLFATPTGKNRLPEKIEDISAFDFGSDRLARFLGKW